MNQNEKLCYYYEVSQGEANVYQCGWIDAMSQNEAEDKLVRQYKLDSKGDIRRISQNGTWAKFISDGDKYGWD